MNQQYEDVYGNVFSIDKELSSGGQGIVYKTKEPNVLLKIEWDPQTKRINLNTEDNKKFADSTKYKYHTSSIDIKGLCWIFYEDA